MKKSDSKNKFNEIYIEDHFKQPQDGVDGTLYNDDPENALKEDYIDNPQQEQNVNDDNMSHHSGNTIETEYIMADSLGSTLSTRANSMTDLNISQSNSNELSDSKSSIDSSKPKQSFTGKIMDSRSNNSKDKGSGRF